MLQQDRDHDRAHIHKLEAMVASLAHWQQQMQQGAAQATAQPMCIVGATPISAVPVAAMPPPQPLKPPRSKRQRSNLATAADGASAETTEAARNGTAGTAAPLHVVVIEFAIALAVPPDSKTATGLRTAHKWYKDGE